MNKSDVFHVSFDEPRNLLVILYQGHVRAAEAKQCLDAVRRIIGQVHSGFRILADLSGLDSMDPSCAPYLENIMDLCNAAGVSVIARAIPHRSRDIGLGIMSVFHYRKDVRTITCDTTAEALSALEDEPGQI